MYFLHRRNTKGELDSLLICSLTKLLLWHPLSLLTWWILSCSSCIIFCFLFCYNWCCNCNCFLYYYRQQLPGYSAPQQETLLPQRSRRRFKYHGCLCYAFCKSISLTSFHHNLLVQVWVMCFIIQIANMSWLYEGIVFCSSIISLELGIL